MSTRIIPLPRTDLQRVAPNYEAMRQAIEVCQRVDEVASIGDQAVAVQAYFRQSQDVENEMHASRIRMRAERRLGEILRIMAANGERASKGDRAANVAPRDISTLADLGIPRDRASRAMQLADVPQEQFDAALGKTEVAQPRKLLRETRTPVRKPLKVPIEKTLLLWGTVRDFGSQIEHNEMPPLIIWRENLQPFQLAHLTQYIPTIIAYLSAIQQELAISGSRCGR